MLHSWMTLAETSAICEHPIDLYQVLDRRIVDSLRADAWVIALFNAARDDVSFPHSSGEIAQPAQRLTRHLARTLAARLTTPGATLYLSTELITQLLADKPAKSNDITPRSGWLVALRDETHLTGFVAIWNYVHPIPERADDALFLRFASYLVGPTLARRRDRDALRVVSSELERRVEQRTRELNESNAELRRQADERERNAGSSSAPASSTSPTRNSAARPTSASAPRPSSSTTPSTMP